MNRLAVTGSPQRLLGALVDVTSEYNGDRTDYRVAVDHQQSDNLMYYAQVSTGYKGGGVNPRPFSVSQAVPYDPEELDAFEIEAEIRPTDNLAIDLSAGVLDFQYTNVDPATFVTPDVATICVHDRKYAFGIQYDFVLQNGSRLTPRLGYSYRSEIQTLAIETPLTLIDDLNLTTLRVIWESADEVWRATWRSQIWWTSITLSPGRRRQDSPSLRSTSSIPIPLSCRPALTVIMKITPSTVAI